MNVFDELSDEDQLKASFQMASTGCFFVSKRDDGSYYYNDEINNEEKTIKVEGKNNEREFSTHTRAAWQRSRAKDI